MALKQPPRRILQHTATREFLEEHQALMEWVELILGADDVAPAREAMDKARRFLAVHMAEEEAPDGVFDWLGAIAPELHESIHGLSMDHLELRDQIAEIASLQGSDDDAELQRLKVFAHHLKAHERREKAVLVAALEIDEGSDE